MKYSSFKNSHLLFENWRRFAEADADDSSGIKEETLEEDYGFDWGKAIELLENNGFSNAAQYLKSQLIPEKSLEET